MQIPGCRRDTKTHTRLIVAHKQLGEIRGIYKPENLKLSYDFFPAEMEQQEPDLLSEATKKKKVKIYEVLGKKWQSVCLQDTGHQAMKDSDL